MTQHHHQETARHYGPRASAYVASALHADGPDLDRIEAILAGRRVRRALDLGCGGGHVSYRAARHVEEVIACDVTPAMVSAVEETAGGLGLCNIRGVVAPAEALPFEAGFFDAVLCRFTAHHWQDMQAGLVEARRVAKPGATIVFIDTAAPADRASDTHLQVIEYLRDPSHVRNYSIMELRAALADAGFVIDDEIQRSLRMGFDEWTRRTGTPADRVAMLRLLQREAGTEVRRTLAIGEDGSFALEAVTLTGTAE
jgi:SAM-dependent methyltransferase